MAPATDTLSVVFAALADPTRRGILSRLSQGTATVGELAAPYEISAPAISQHLRVLESAGLIERTRQAQWRTCSIRTEPLDDAAAWVDKHRAEWTERFDLLDERLTELKAQRPDSQKRSASEKSTAGHKRTTTQKRSTTSKRAAKKKGKKHG